MVPLSIRIATGTLETRITYLGLRNDYRAEPDVVARNGRRRAARRRLQRDPRAVQRKTVGQGTRDSSVRLCPPMPKLGSLCMPNPSATDSCGSKFAPSSTDFGYQRANFSSDFPRAAHAFRATSHRRCGFARLVSEFWHRASSKSMLAGTLSATENAFGRQHCQKSQAGSRNP